MQSEFDVTIDMGFDALYGYLSSVIDDFNPSAASPSGLQGYVEKLVQNGRVIVAISTPFKKVVAGILAGYFNNPGQGFSYISAFHVRVPFRRMHIGRMLMDKAVEISRIGGFKSIRLKVDKSNHGGIVFYERFGFVKIGEDEKQFEMNYSL